MTSREDAFLQELRATFRVEAAEHLQSIASGLLELETSPASPDRGETVATVFRAAHSLKGAARAVDFGEIEALCQTLEDTFAVWKRENTAPTQEAFDAAHRLLDSITGAMSPESQPSEVEPPSTSIKDPAGRREGGGNGVNDSKPVPHATDHAALPFDETVRITVAKLDARLVEAEKMVGAKLSAGQRVKDLRELRNRMTLWKREWNTIASETRSLRQISERPDPARNSPLLATSLNRLVEGLERNQEYFTTLESEMASFTRAAEQDHHTVGALVDDLLDDSKKLLLLPFSTLSAAFPKLVRDLCRDLGKEADFVIHGETVEIDKRILEEMKDSLVHILRNCVDHGIEPLNERVASGKRGRATISLSVSQLDGNKVEIVVADDGKGIDTESVKQAAIAKGLISQSDANALTEADARTLIFASDVSTSPIITHLSGRGLGLAIVKEKAEKLGGAVSVQKNLPHGTVFSIIIPSTLATFRGILVDVGEHTFVVPTLHVEHVVRVRGEEIQTVEGHRTLSYLARTIPLVSMADVLALTGAIVKPTAVAEAPALIIGLGDQRIAFAVDAVLGEQEVLLKPFAKPLTRVRNVAGATTLGSGAVVPVLNVQDMLKSARVIGGRSARVAAASEKGSQNQKSLLVVEDSITSRMLLKNILEAGGYTVRTAVDGMEGFTLLRTEKFDGVVSDVEMPRMNGFELTRRIRADETLSHLPIVLVTALESKEDRERGIDVGANAYIIKNNFDQSDLLKTLGLLL